MPPRSLASSLRAYCSYRCGSAYQCENKSAAADISGKCSAKGQRKSLSSSVPENQTLQRNRRQYGWYRPAISFKVIKIMTIVIFAPLRSRKTSIPFVYTIQPEIIALSKHLRWVIFHDLHTNFDKGRVSSYSNIGIIFKMPTPQPCAIASPIKTTSHKRISRLQRVTQRDFALPQYGSNGIFSK